MAKDYIPKSDAELASFLDNFATKIASDKSKFSFSDAEVTELTTANTDYQTALTELAEAEDNYNAKLEAKRQAEERAVAATRARAQQIQANPNIADEERAGLRLPVRDKQPTRVSVPESFPIIVIDNSKRLQQTLRYFDSNTPTSRARPDNARGAEVVRFIGATAPTGPEQFERLDESSRSPYVVQYTGADAGKTAYYMMRWVNSRGERGPWSETVSATITG
jgi:hypothetical protein